MKQASGQVSEQAEKASTTDVGQGIQQAASKVQVLSPFRLSVDEMHTSAVQDNDEMQSKILMKCNVVKSAGGSKGCGGEARRDCRYCEGSSGGC